MRSHLPHFSLLDCLIDKGSDTADIAVSAELADDLSVFEHKDLRDGHDAVLLGKIHILIDIDLGKFYIRIFC